MANKDKQLFTLAVTSKEWKEAGEGRQPMWTWREHAHSSQHRKAPDTTKYDPRIFLQRGWVTSDSSLGVDSGPFEIMRLASSSDHQITACLLWGENENRLPWCFQISALHFRVAASLQRYGPVLNGKVCDFCSPVDTEEGSNTCEYGRLSGISLCAVGDCWSPQWGKVNGFLF